MSIDIRIGKLSIKYGTKEPWTPGNHCGGCDCCDCDDLEPEPLTLWARLRGLFTRPLTLEEVDAAIRDGHDLAMAEIPPYQTGPLYEMLKNPKGEA